MKIVENTKLGNELAEAGQSIHLVTPSETFSEEVREPLECEKFGIFLALMFVSGFYGAYTYLLRGGVFANAQTANFLMLAIALGNFQFAKALYYLIPMAAYLLGTILSESLPLKVRRFNLLRWDTILIAFEAIMVLLLAFLPEEAPFQIPQVAISFICSMQYNTFRQSKNLSLATTFCTNHIRQVGIRLVKMKKYPGQDRYSKEMMVHLKMLLSFVLGAVSLTLFVKPLGGKSILGALPILLLVFMDLARADLSWEREKIHLTPKGH